MVKGTEPFISIITLNHNQTAATCDFLESSRKLDYTNYEIIVCDMNSVNDPSPDLLRLNIPGLIIKRSQQNLGFAAGNNFGIAEAKGDFLLIINNDTEVTPQLLTQMVTPFTQDRSVGIVSPKIKYYSNRSVIEYAGFRKMNMLTGRTSAIGFKEEDLGQYDVSGFTAAAHGCAMMIPKKLMNELGGFYEPFFLYYEEWDLSERLKKIGFKVWYEASAVVYHHASLSVGDNSHLKTYYQSRNRILFMRRNASRVQFAIFLLFFILFSLPKTIISFLFSRRSKQLTYFIKGSAWNLYNSPGGRSYNSALENEVKKFNR